MFSYVEPIINVAVLSLIDLRRDLASLLKLDFPEVYLPTFLHEGTHHSCFMSPLGTALALLRMRAYRRATRLRNHPDGDHWDLLEDVLRQEVTMEALRPLSEGLACFSELDAIPGRSNVITVPMLSTFVNFGGIENEFKAKDAIKEHGVDLFLFSLLYRARIHPDLTQRRENVLAGRFPLEFGGYLPGYMAIKNIWGYARANSDLAQDAELFSAFVRSFFYDDYGFIAVLLDPSVSEHNAANAIGGYFLTRLKQLLQIDWESSLADFEKHYGRTKNSAVAGDHLMHVHPGGLCNEEQLCAVGEARLGELYSELSEADEVDGLETIMRQSDLTRLRKRELLCLGSLDAEVEVNSYHRVLVRARDGDGIAEWPTTAVQALEGVKEGKGEGSLEFYLIPANNARAYAVVRGSEIVYANIEGPISEVRKEQLGDLFGTRAKDLEIIRTQEANLEHVISGDLIAFVRSQAKATAPKAIEKIYFWMATLSVIEERWQLAAGLLKEGGLYRLCSSDAAFIEGLSFVGMASTVCPDKRELIAIGQARGIDVECVCEKARLIEAETGLPTIREIEGRILAVL